jgi:integrase
LAGEGDSDLTEKNVPKSNIFNYAWYLKKNGRAESTIKTVIERLTRLSKLCNIQEPEELKATLAKLEWSNNTKRSIVIYLNGFLKFLNKHWEPPKYKSDNKLPFIPTEEELNMLISASPQIIATLLQFLKETGVRIGEAMKLEWTDIDLKRRTAHITPEKYSNPRILPLSNTLINMLNSLARKNEFVFYLKYKTTRESYRYNRNKTAKKLKNPRLKKITFHTFRHWKGTTEYHKTKDIIHVKTILGHKEIKSTMVYINIESALFLTQSDEYTCKATTNDNEATKLIENGFEHHLTTPNGLMIFRKRK